MTVFRKRVVFDTSDFECGLGSPYLVAPSGKGIEKIEIPASVAKTGYHGSPEVKITGDGVGATAFCEFDEATGTIGPITITSPGWDYTTATATIRSGDRTQTISLDVTLAEQPSGGLVKLGSHKLNVKGSNTYAGDTIISNGPLVMVTAACIPVTNAVMVAGGELDLNAVTTHQLGVLGGFGAVRNGTLAVDGLRFNARDLLATNAYLTATATLNVAAEATVSITEPELLPETGRSYTLLKSSTALSADLVLEGLEQPWKLVRLDEGKTLKLLYAAGTTLILR